MAHFEPPHPEYGYVGIRTYPLPKDTNGNGDIFGGWILAQMDLAAAAVSGMVAGGRLTTIAVDAMTFLKPVLVGDIVTCFGVIARVGTTSIKVKVTTIVKRQDQEEPIKVTEGLFTMVCIDAEGHRRPVPRPLPADILIQDA